MATSPPILNKCRVFATLSFLSPLPPLILVSRAEIFSFCVSSVYGGAHLNGYRLLVFPPSQLVTTTTYDPSAALARSTPT